MSNVNKKFLKKYGTTSPTSEFNCWGATLMYFNKLKRPKWVLCEDMESFLAKKTKQIKITNKPKINTIVSIWGGDYWELSHTAVYIGKGKWYHKRGSNIAEIVCLEEIRRLYDGDIKFHQLKTNKKAA